MNYYSWRKPMADEPMNDNDKPMTRDELIAAFDQLINTDWPTAVSNYEQKLEAYTKVI